MSQAQLSTYFAETFGRNPRVTCVSPGRVNLIGEHTDYNQGWVLPVALSRHVRVAASARADGVICVVSRQYPFGSMEARVSNLAPGTVGGWSAYVLGAAWALREFGAPLSGADLLVDSDIPVGAGLSSSAALECATVGALATLSGMRLADVERAQVAQRAENDFVGVPCGIMDQMASVFGRPGHALLVDTRTLAIEHLSFLPEAENLTLLIVDTMVRHSLSASTGYAARRRECAAAASYLRVQSLRDVDDLARVDEIPDATLRRRAAHVLSENHRVWRVAGQLREGHLRAIGPELTASHVSLRDDFDVSSQELDVAVDAMLGAGAIGARMTGGGFGGCAIALVECTQLAAVCDAVQEAFAACGFKAPEFLSATSA
jgi:galactokinase